MIMYLKKLQKYINKNNYIQYGGLYENEPILFISGHGEIASPIKMFEVPSNIVVVTSSQSGAYATFDIREISKTGRLEIIKNAEKDPEKIYDKGTLFPEMEIRMDTEYTNVALPEKFFGYTGIISDDYKPFIHPVTLNSSSGSLWLGNRWHGYMKDYPDKSIETIALQHHNTMIMPITYKKKYLLSNIIHNIIKYTSRYNAFKKIYIIVSACRCLSIEVNSRICGKIMYEMFSTGMTRTIDSPPNFMTKHLLKNITLSNIHNHEKDPCYFILMRNMRNINYDKFVDFFDKITHFHGVLIEDRWTVFKYNLEGICFLTRYIEIKKLEAELKEIVCTNFWNIEKNIEMLQNFTLHVINKLKLNDIMKLGQTEQDNFYSNIFEIIRVRS